MSRDGSITLTWGGDERVFRLDIAALLALQESCKAGPAEIAGRLASGMWRIADAREPLRLGLIGGGLAGPVARRLVDDNAGPGQLAAGALVSYVVLMAALQGDPDDPVGKEQAAPEVPEGATTPAGTTVPSATDASPPPPSTDPAP